jgi:hypothetical protein
LLRAPDRVQGEVLDDDLEHPASQRDLHVGGRFDTDADVRSLGAVGKPVASLLQYRQRKRAAEGDDLAAALELGKEQHVVDQLLHLLNLLPRVGKQGVAIRARQIGRLQQGHQSCQRRPQLVRDSRRETDPQLLVRPRFLHHSRRVWPKS